MNYNQSNPNNHENPTVSNGTQNVPLYRPSAEYTHIPSVQINIPQDITHATTNALPTLRPNTQYDVVRDLCFNYISERLGNKWKIVGRYLGLREGTMDVIYKKHRNDMQAQTLEV